MRRTLYLRQNGKARYRSVYARSYAECRQKLRACRKEADIPKTKITVSRLFEAWLENRKSSVKQSTYVNYRTLYESHIKGTIGGLICGEITADMLSKYVSYLLESGNVYGCGLSAAR